MANSFDTLFGNLATDLLDKFGKSITLTVVTDDGTLNPDTGEPTITETPQTVKAKLEPYTDKRIDGEYIQVGDIKVIMKATVTPTRDDFFTIDSVKYEIINISTEYAVEDQIIHTVQARRSAA